MMYLSQRRKPLSRTIGHWLFLTLCALKFRHTPPPEKNLWLEFLCTQSQPPLPHCTTNRATHNDWLHTNSLKSSLKPECMTINPSWLLVYLSSKYWDNVSYFVHGTFCFIIISFHLHNYDFHYQIRIYSLAHSLSCIYRVWSTWLNPPSILYQFSYQRQCKPKLFHHGQTSVLPENNLGGTFFA